MQIDLLVMARQMTMITTGPIAARQDTPDDDADIVLGSLLGSLTAPVLQCRPPAMLYKGRDSISFIYSLDRYWPVFYS